MIKRLTSAFFVCALLSCFLMIPAKASLINGTGSLTAFFNRTGPIPTEWFEATDYEASYSTNVATSLGGYSHNTTSTYVRGMGQLTVPLEDVIGTVTVACSYLLYGNSSDNTFYSNGDLTPVTSWYDANKNVQTGSGSSLTFTANGDPFKADAYSVGVTISGVFEGSEVSPISQLVISWSPQFCCGRIKKGGTQNVGITSFRVITTDASAATAAQLEEIAQNVAEQNNILSAMYADILAVCNSIYERTGDLLTAQNLTNQYFASIIPLLNNISSTTSNIYSLLSTQFSLLISTIQSESDDIQAAINAAVDRMIAYLDGAFSSSVNPALPGTSEDINTGVDSWNQAESGYQSNASERFQSITADFSGFSGDVLSGIGLASTLFQRVWNALGSYVVLYTVPLTLSLCLLVVGRVSCSHSRGGGSSKSKDDGGET